MEFMLLQSCADRFGFSFVTRLVEQGKHILLVSLYTRLVEGIDTQQVTADAASLFKEVEQAADAFLGQCGYRDAHVGYATVYVSQLSAQFGHFVDFIHTLACQEVQAVQVSASLGTTSL